MVTSWSIRPTASAGTDRLAPAPRDTLPAEERGATRQSLGPFAWPAFGLLARVWVKLISPRPRRPPDRTVDTVNGEVPRILPPDALKLMLGRELERALRARSVLSLLTIRVERTSDGAPADEQTVARVADQVELVMRERDLLGHLEAGTLALVLIRSDLDQATRVAGRLMSDLAGQPFPSTVRLAIGVACYPTNATTATSLARWALTHPMTTGRAGSRTSMQHK